MAHIPSAAEKPLLSARRQFIVRQNEQGDWCACDEADHVVRVCPTLRDAIHFALYETGTRCAAVSLTPPR